ncbi:helix-turn-helix domain-containing protein [Rhodococcus hoagii]|nr:helix-turn-helix domain-containing protein [Prescottella equi]
MLVESLGGGFMSQGSESTAPWDLPIAAELIEELADSGEHVAVIALPDSAASFIADTTGGGEVRIWRVARATEAISEMVLNPAFERPDRGAIRRSGTIRTSAPFVFSRGQSVEKLVQLMVDASSSPEDATEAAADEWGPAISDEKAARLEQANLKLQVEHRRQELSVSMSRSEAADALGVSPQTVSEWVSQRKLVGLKDGREWRFPAWQFTPDSAEPVLPDLDRLMAAFPGGEVSLSRWMNRPNDNFGGRTPAQEMARDSDHVLAIVETLAAT